MEIILFIFCSLACICAFCLTLQMIASTKRAIDLLDKMVFKAQQDLFELENKRRIE